VSSSDIDLCVVKQINLSARICVRKQTTEQTDNGTNEAYLSDLFVQQQDWDRPFKDFLSLVLPITGDVALGTLSVYLCPRSRIPEQEENMLFLQGNYDGRKEKADCSGK